MMAYQLRDQGLVATMEDPISKYNPNFFVYNPWGLTPAETNSSNLRLNELLSQTSGSRERGCILPLDLQSRDLRKVDRSKFVFWGRTQVCLEKSRVITEPVAILPPLKF